MKLIKMIIRKLLANFKDMLVKLDKKNEDAPLVLTEGGGFSILNNFYNRQH